MDPPDSRGTGGHARPGGNRVDPLTNLPFDVTIAVSKTTQAKRLDEFLEGHGADQRPLGRRAALAAKIGHEASVAIWQSVHLRVPAVRRPPLGRHEFAATRTGRFAIAIVPVGQQHLPTDLVGVIGIRELERNSRQHLRERVPHLSCVREIGQSRIGAQNRRQAEKFRAIVRLESTLPDIGRFNHIADAARVGLVVEVQNRLRGFGELSAGQLTHRQIRGERRNDGRRNGAHRIGVAQEFLRGIPVAEHRADRRRQIDRDLADVGRRHGPQGIRRQTRRRLSSSIDVNDFTKEPVSGFIDETQFHLKALVGLLEVARNFEETRETPASGRQHDIGIRVEIGVAVSFEINRQALSLVSLPGDEQVRKKPIGRVMAIDDVHDILEVLDEREIRGEGILGSLRSGTQVTRPFQARTTGAQDRGGKQVI